MDELRELAIEQSSIIKKNIADKENREKSQQHQINISKHYAQVPTPTFSSVDVSNRNTTDPVNDSTSRMTPERRVADVPMLSPTLNFTLEEDF